METATVVHAKDIPSTRRNSYSLVLLPVTVFTSSQSVDRIDEVSKNTLFARKPALKQSQKL